MSETLLAEFPTGVYSGTAEFGGKVYKAATSIGFNPYYDNDSKTIEVYLINYSGSDFYGETVKLQVNHYIRAESKFIDFAELVTSIAYDIKIVSELI